MVRRRSSPGQIDEEDDSMGTPLHKHMTNQEARSSAPDMLASQAGGEDGTSAGKKSRLRSLSETFGGLLNPRDREGAARRGKRRDGE
jgi:hypothetical protein